MFLSLGDGRIVRAYHVNQDGDQVLQWETLVRTGVDDENCGKGGPTDLNNMEQKCGRPLGMAIVNKSRVIDAEEDEDVLIVADAYRGLLLISGLYDTPKNVKLTAIATHAVTDAADKKPFQLLNGIVSAPDGSIFFTETSRNFQRRRIFYAAFDGRASGRLLRYTKDRGVEVMADGIYMPNGLAVSHDENHLLIVSGVQILSYSLKNKAMEMSLFANMPGTGDNIVAHDQLPDGSAAKCYWAALGSKFAEPFSLLKSLSDKPLLKSLLVALVPYKTIVNAIPKLSALAVYGEDGTLLDVYRDEEASVPWLSEGVTFEMYLYLGSWYNDYIGRVKVENLSR
jgi:hypothetical protein